MSRKFDFVNKIVRQGNSLCVRIPNSIVKQGNLEEGMDAHLQISAPEIMYAYNEKNVALLLTIANNIKTLQKYDDLKKRFFIMLNFEFLKQTSVVSEEESEQKQIDFINHKKKEFGNKIIDEFIDFSIILNKEAYIMDGNVAILKEKYQKYL